MLNVKGDSFFTESEKNLLRGLPSREAQVFQDLKTYLVGGLLTDCSESSLKATDSAPPTYFEGTLYTHTEPGLVPPDPPKGTLTFKELRGNERVQAPGDRQQATAGPLTFIDPEDIPFGKPRLKPSQSIIELSWTWNKHRVVKTKKLGARKMRAWKRWHQRQGYKVVGSSEEMIASKDGHREAITLRVWPKPAPQLSL